MAKKSPQAYTLSGRITDQQNQPIEGLIVRAFDQDPGTPENLLGQATTTNAKGKYSISFAEKDFKVGSVESGGPDVFIRVYEGEMLLGESPVSRNSKQIIKIDLKVKYEKPRKITLSDDTPLFFNARGQTVKALHQDLQKIGFRLPQQELAQERFGAGTASMLKQFQSKNKLLVSGILDDATKLALKVAANAAFDKRHSVEGRLFLDNGTPADGVTLKVYAHQFGDKASLLGEVKTDADGFYHLPYEANSGIKNLQIKTINTKGEEIPLTTTKQNPVKEELINLVAPLAEVRVASAEFHRLKQDIETQIQDFGKLAEARETADRQDITFLRQATGWDARLVAVAANAVKLSNETGLSQEAAYGIARAGLPIDAATLTTMPSEMVEKALKKSVEAGIVHLNENQITGAKRQFEQYSRVTLMTQRVQGALSTVGEMLESSVLNRNEKKTFEEVLFLKKNEPEVSLWDKAKESGISDSKIAQLKQQGKLAYLTRNNARLTTSLVELTGQEENLSGLVDNGFYRKEAWMNHIQTLAGNDNEVKKSLIPPAYLRDNVDEAVDAYADDLSRRIRLSFPTRVIAEMVKNEELKLGENHAVLKDPVRAFLLNAEKLDFELGKKPLNSFINENNAALYQGIPAELITDVEESVKRMTRLQQITPSDDALAKLSQQPDINSAFDVTNYPFDKWMVRFTPIFDVMEARLIYRKAQQVTTVLYNFYTMGSEVINGSANSITVISPPQQEREKAKNRLIRHFPTMENLFGSLDYCECEHCRSVLSPAAYFVDLLKFLDPEPGDWNYFLTNWATTHPGTPYPGGSMTPYQVLIERRPDLPHLPLTCENTNTALPYIDVANEILEFYVAKGNLSEKAVQDTGTATSQELIAEPQNIIADAYDKLREAKYPLNLPFDLWLETTRRFLEYFETPLWKLLDVFRQTDELFPPAADPKPYYRADIFNEQLELAPVEEAIFVNETPLANWWKLYGYETEPAELSGLSSAKKLSRKLGISYKEVVELVKTAFINPNLVSLVFLNKLDVELKDVFRYKSSAGYVAFSTNEIAAFEARLSNLSETYDPFDAKEWLDEAWDNGKFENILLLADPDTGCNFDSTTLQYATRDAATNLDFLKINLFVRLWKKLGWNMEDTDRALQVFLPKNSMPLTSANIGDAFRTALIGMAHLQTLESKVNVGKNAKQKLLTLWSNLSTTGKAPLYASLFLTRSILKNDPIFDHPLGEYLTTAGVLVKDHLAAIQSALGMNAEEARMIFSDASSNLDVAELNLNNVSLLHRYRLLSKGLGLSIKDFISLKKLSGLNPFESLHADPLTTLDQDQPFTKTLAFVEMTEHLKASGFKPEDLDYLLRHSYDPNGKYRPNPTALMTLVKLIAGELRRIQAENTVPADAALLTDEILQQKLPLAFPPDAAATFMGMWAGNVEWKVSVGAQPAEALEPADFINETEIVALRYDAVRERQELTYRGMLFDERKTELTTAHVSPVFASLLNEVQSRTTVFFNAHLLKRVIIPIGGFLDATDFEKLFKPVDVSAIADEMEKEKEKQKWENERRKRFGEAFLPYLQERLNRQIIVQTLATALPADPALTETLLTDVNLLAKQPGGTKLLEAFAALSKPGINATWFASNDATGPASGVDILATADTIGKPASVQSVLFEGFLEVPATGAYRFFAFLGKANASAELRFEHLSSPLISGTAATDGQELDEFTELKAGTPYRFTFTVTNLSDGDAALSVMSENMTKGYLSRLTLLPSSTVERVNKAQTLLAKTLQLIQALKLNEREIRYLCTSGPALVPFFNLSDLPPSDGIIDDAALLALFQQFTRLLTYSRIRAEIAGDGDDLIGIFEQADTATLEELYRRFATLTRRDDYTVVKDAAEHLGFAASNFKDEKALERLWEILKVVEKLGVSVKAMAHWTSIVGKEDSLADRKRKSEIARSLKNTLKARFEPEAWQRVAQSVFDKLRKRQRDALVAWALANKGFDRIEQLFEYFLLDPGMEPVVQTSRLRLAISCVQTFIQRCLLNLEPNVSPSAITVEHWQWMKHYRVWEANRKIFLYPENWLEPEFRDDKTHLFKEVESLLLQNDVSKEVAESAFLTYLKGLDVLARLDIVTMYLEEKYPPADNTLHVVGRTYKQPHKYYYRRYAHKMWTPWEPMDVEIEGDHMAMVVWRERPHIFWITFLEQASENSNDTKKPEGMAKESVSESKPDRLIQVQLNWSEYIEGTWTTRETGGFSSPINIGKTKFNTNYGFIHLTKDREETTLKIHLGHPIKMTFRVVGKNSRPILVGEYEDPQELPYWINNYKPINPSRHVTDYLGIGALSVAFVEKTFINGLSSNSTHVTKSIIENADEYEFLTTSNALKFPPGQSGKLIRPFFFKDKHHSFFVEPNLIEKTVKTWNDWVYMAFYTPPSIDWSRIIIEAEYPIFTFDPGFVDPMPPEIRYGIRDKLDWVVNPSTFYQFDETYIGQDGKIELAVLPRGVIGNDFGGLGIEENLPGGNLLVNVNPGSEAIEGSSILVRAGSSMANNLRKTGNQVSIIGSQGLNAKTVDALGRTLHLSSNLNLPNNNLDIQNLTPL